MPLSRRMLLSIGAYEMAKDRDGFSCADWYTVEDGTDWYCREDFATFVDACGHGIIYCDIGGAFAREMSDQGTAAMFDFLVSDLKKAHGAEIAKHIVRSHTFDWTQHPLPKGAYASAKAGGACARRRHKCLGAVCYVLSLCDVSQ